MRASLAPGQKNSRRELLRFRGMFSMPGKYGCPRIAWGFVGQGLSTQSVLRRGGGQCRPVVPAHAPYDGPWPVIYQVELVRHHSGVLAGRPCNMRVRRARIGPLRNMSVMLTCWGRRHLSRDSRLARNELTRGTSIAGEPPIQAGGAPVV